MALSEQLSDYAQGVKTRLSPETRDAFAKAAAEFERRKIGETALKSGDNLPDVALLTATGDRVAIRDYLRNGPIILSFYRGGWCPYCNLELKAYQALLPDILEAGGQLIAVSPEVPDRAISTTEKNDLAFPVLTDENLSLAKAMGISFEYTTELKETYLGFGMDMEEINAGGGWALPVPATFVISQSGNIVLAHVERDYETRLEPSVAVTCLKNL